MALLANASDPLSHLYGCIRSVPPARYFCVSWQIPLRIAFSRATIEGFAYETWVKIKLSTGVCINYQQGLWTEKF